MPSSTSIPKASFQRRWSGSGSASPADVQRRRQLRSCRAALGWSSIACIMVGTLTRMVGRCRAISSKISSGVVRSAKITPVRADPEREQCRQVAGIPEEQLRHRKDDVVRAETEHALRVALKADDRAARRVHAGLRLAGAPGGELPDRDVVARRRARDEIGRLARDAATRRTPRARPATPVPGVHHQERRAHTACRRGLAHALEGDAVDDHHRGLGVVEVVRVVLGLQERVHLGGHGADLLHGVPGGDELHRVGEREEHALAAAGRRARAARCRRGW